MKLSICKFLIVGILIALLNSTVIQAQVKDIEGKLYKTCKIGSHELMAENLSTSTFNNGDKILEAKTDEEWIAAYNSKTPAWCYYDNNSYYGDKYGKLYNVFAFKDSRKILPVGWKTISDLGWDDLKEILGEQEFWIKLRSTSSWEKSTMSKDFTNTNETGFNLLATGYRSKDGTFKSMGLFTYLWKSTNYLEDVALGIGYNMKSWQMYTQEIPRKGYPMGMCIRGERDLSKSQEAIGETANPDKKVAVNNSEYGQMNDKIQIKYKKWLQKEEFEKSDDYQNRLIKNSSSVFNEICFSILEENFDKSPKFEYNLQDYNADTEKFGIEFHFKDLHFKDSLAIPIKNAPTFRKEIKNFYTYINDQNWRFVDNSLVPTEITFYNSKNSINYLCDFSIKNFKDIIFTSTQLKTISAISSNNIFDFNSFYYDAAFRNKDGSAINSLAWDNLLHKNFQQALEILEKGIPLINKEESVYPYLLTNLAHAYLFNNQLKKARKVYYDNFSIKLNNKTWKEAILQDFDVFKTRGFKNDDMEEIKQKILLR